MKPSILKRDDKARIEYSYDSRGLVVWPNFLTASEIEDARCSVDSLPLLEEPWHDGQKRGGEIHRAPGCLSTLSATLFDHPVTRLLIGYPHRLLESYAITRDRGQLDLHGGRAEFLSGKDARDISSRSWVEDRKIYSLRVKVLVYLDDVVEPEDGRFAYVEGSHKAAFAFHRAFPNGRMGAFDLWRTVEVHAGDVIWLNESMLHGAEEKTSQKRRRLLAFTYGPAFMVDWRELNVPSLQASGYHSAETEGDTTRERFDE